MIEVRKYRQSRFWAVYVDGELLAVVVYRKGAVAIADHLTQAARHLALKVGPTGVLAVVVDQ